jgi:hypothetical protein
MIVLAPISVGELIDKITILRIKTQLLTDADKLKNVESELQLLEELRDECNIPIEIDNLEHQLYKVNKELWDIENYKRACEREQNFGIEFVNAARQVYLKNDQRAVVKREINTICGSNIVEEKSY